MGRTKIGDEQKRKQVAVRLGPRDRERIERLASEHGNSVGAEVEQLALDQLAYLEGVDGKTQELVAAIIDEIQLVTNATKKSWNKDRKTWAAVAEMLQRGPIQDCDPDDPMDDPISTEKWQTLREFRDEKEGIAQRLREIGVSVTADHPSTRRNQSPRSAIGLFANALAAPVSIRHTEEAAIESLPDGKVKDEARGLFAQLRELDDKEHEADREWSEALEPYFEAVFQGRDVYRSILHERAAARAREGKYFNYAHLMKWWTD